MKTLFKSKKLLMLLVATVMVATTSLSFTFWLYGITGTEGTRNDANITIGSGKAVLTTIDLSKTPGEDYGKYLIPESKASLIASSPDSVPDNRYSPDTHTTSITAEYKVKWEHNLTEPSSVDGTVADLFVTNTVIWLGEIGGSGEDVKNVNGKGGTPLFIVDFNYDNRITVNDTTATVVTVTIKMNEPADKDQYTKFANKQLFFEFKFEVVTEDDKA